MQTGAGRCRALVHCAVSPPLNSFPIKVNRASNLNSPRDAPHSTSFTPRRTESQSDSPVKPGVVVVVPSGVKAASLVTHVGALSLSVIVPFPIAFLFSHLTINGISVSCAPKLLFSLSVPLSVFLSVSLSVCLCVCLSIQFNSIEKKLHWHGK